MRLLPVLLLVAALALISPAQAQPRDEAPEASPAGPTSTSVAEELTSKTTEQPPAEEKPVAEEEKKPVKKPEPEKKKKPAPKPEKKPAKKAQPVKKEAVKKEPAKEEPPAKKAEAPKPAPAISSGKDPVIVINPCTGEVSEEASAPEAKTLSIQPGKQKSCLTARQCDALCRVGESFGEGGGAPYLSPRGYIVFGMDAFTSFEACIETCGPKCK